MEVSSELGFWEFTKKRDNGGQYAPCRNLGGTEPKESRGCNTEMEAVKHRETTHLSVI